MVDVAVRSEDEAVELVERSKDLFTHLVSIGCPGRPPRGNPMPKAFKVVPSVLRLEFDDVPKKLPGAFPPKGEHVRQIITLGRELPDDARVLVHCHAGISRSTATAFILWAVKLGKGQEKEALERVLKDRPIAQPNMLMVRYADNQLKRQGKMVELNERLHVLTQTSIYVHHL